MFPMFPTGGPVDAPAPLRWVEPGRYLVTESGLYVGALVVVSVSFEGGPPTRHTCRWAGGRTTFEATTEYLEKLGLPVRTL